MSIKLKMLLRILIILTLIIIALVVGYAKFNLLYLQINNKNEMINTKEYTIMGETNASVIYIEFNNQRKEKIYSENGNFKYILDLSTLNQGWNYIRFIVKNTFPMSEIKRGAAINIIANQPDVFLPDLNLFDARINGNKSNYKNFEDKTEFYLKNNYRWNGYYFDCLPHEKSENFDFDDEGIPLARYGEQWEYNPVTVAQEGLGLYNILLSDDSEENRKKFLNIADWLVEHQEKNGSYLYDFSFALKSNLELPKGFVSGMAQGQILSCLARAYNITQNKIYLEAGYKALKFMLASGDKNERGGCSKLLQDICKNSDELSIYSNYRIIEEYVTDPSSYVLNGDLYALIGLYDWWQVTDVVHGKSEAKDAFEDGINSVEVILPYYDYYGWSSYDLLQYTYDSSPYFTSAYAHHCHIYLLNALYHDVGVE